MAEVEVRGTRVEANGGRLLVYGLIDWALPLKKVLRPTTLG